MLIELKRFCHLRISKYFITFLVTGNTAIGETREDLLEEGGLENITSYIPEELVEFILADNKVGQAFNTFNW